MGAVLGLGRATGKTVAGTVDTLLDAVVPFDRDELAEFLDIPSHEDFKTGLNTPGLFGPFAILWIGYIKGTVTTQILPYSVAIGLIGLLVHFLYLETQLSLAPQYFSVLSTAVAFLLVFRTQLCYSRYDEGRKLIGGLTTSLGLSFSAILSYWGTGRHESDLPQTRLYLDSLRRRTLLMFALCKQHIRESRLGFGKRSPQHNQKFNSLTFMGLRGSAMHSLFQNEEEILYLQGMTTGQRVWAVWTMMVRDVQIGVRKGWLPKIAGETYHLRMETVMTAFTGCSRIANTPVPFAYAHFNKLILTCHLLLSPFAMVSTAGLATPLFAFMLALVLQGIWRLGSEMQNPFGWDANDHDLSKFGAILRMNLIAVQSTLQASSRVSGHQRHTRDRDPDCNYDPDYDRDHDRERMETEGITVNGLGSPDRHTDRHKHSHRPRNGNRDREHNYLASADHRPQQPAPFKITSPHGRAPDRDRYDDHDHQLQRHKQYPKSHHDHVPPPADFVSYDHAGTPHSAHQTPHPGPGHNWR